MQVHAADSFMLLTPFMVELDVLDALDLLPD